MSSGTGDKSPSSDLLWLVGDRPFEATPELTVPIVGQFYKGSKASSLLDRARRKGHPVFLKAEPYNRFDSNAFMVMAFDQTSDEFVHVGYVQRHAAAKLRALVNGINREWRQNEDVFFDDCDDFLVGTLSEVSKDSNGNQNLEIKAVGAVDVASAEDYMRDVPL